MKRNSYEQRKSKIRELKPKRQPKKEQDNSFEKDLIFLLRLREQNEAINQAIIRMKKKIYEKQKVQSIASQDNDQQKKNIEKLMLYHTLLQRPQELSLSPTKYMSLLRQIDGGIYQTQDNIQMIDLYLQRDTANQVEYQQILREYQNDEKERNQQKEQTESQRQARENSINQVVNPENRFEEIIRNSYEWFGQQS